MVKRILTEGKSNTKTAKNSLKTYYLSLQPVNQNSKKENLCKYASDECKRACLQFTGRQGFSNVVKSRQVKTEYFVTQKKEFIDQLWIELSKLDKKGKCAVRLNLLSDVDWNKEFLSFGYDLSALKNVQIYDYTKDYFKVLSNTLHNYNFTFSFSGDNWELCEILLKKGFNVAVVFKERPETFKGFTVIDGDQSDERYLDPKGVIVGLKFKKPKGHKVKLEKFVV